MSDVCVQTRPVPKRPNPWLDDTEFEVGGDNKLTGRFRVKGQEWQPRLRWWQFWRRGWVLSDDCKG